MNPIVMGVCLVMLAVCAAGVLHRLVKGPALLDRVLASDVLLSLVASSIALHMVWSEDYAYLILIVTVSLVGFIGSVSVARFVQPTRPKKPQEAPADSAEGAAETEGPGEPASGRATEVQR